MTNNDRWSDLPNNVLLDKPSAVGHRLPGGKIQCQGCTRTFDDTRNQDDLRAGRQPSCPHCWVALNLTGGNDGNGGEPKPVEPGGRLLQFPNFVLGVEGGFKFQPRYRRADDLELVQALPDEADSRQVVLV
jgi:hypothetical protein